MGREDFPVQVREAGPADMAALAELLHEMECFYEGDAAIDAATAGDRLAAYRGTASEALLLVAMADGCVGFASAFRLFPGRALEPVWYLKELYVAEAWRNRGVGARLMAAACRSVMARGGGRLEFTTDADNAPARGFYGALGAAVVPKVFYRLEDGALAAVAARGPA